MTVEELEVLPDPKRVMEGLRDTGYQFETAVADLIDNSIAAGSRNVAIIVNMDFSGELMLSITDDGCGMNRNGLINAMRYGSDERPDAASLGKFGLGLKTASTAFCKSLSVLSRDDKDAPLLKAKWDIEHVATTRKWELLFSEADDEETTIFESIAQNSSGTLVLWQKIDRLLKSYQDQGGKHAQKALRRNVDKLSAHISMVYQRYLDEGDTRAPNIKISINNQIIEPWDPFASTVSELLVEENLDIEMDGEITAPVTLRAYVLPRKEEFPVGIDPKESKIGNDNQGFYIYRENRMIHGPDWMGMFQKEPHYSLIRIEFSFDHKLDDAFHIDIKKSQIILNEDIFSWLKDTFLPSPRREAERRYRKSQRKGAQEAGKNLHFGSNNAIHAKASSLTTAQIEPSGENEATVTNSIGSTKLKIKISSAKKVGEVHITPVEEILDGLLWQPTYMDRNQGVELNTGHPYYQKVYLPNVKNGVAVQGLDSLLWALCIAELNTVHDSTAKHSEVIRYEVSKLLRSLVEDLPEPDLGESDD